MTYGRGAVVEAADPFDGDAGRPFLIVNTEAHPFHGEQYVAATLTTRTWYDGTVPLSADDFADGGVPADSFVVPWGVASPGDEDITRQFGRVRADVVEEEVDELIAYLR